MELNEFNQFSMILTMNETDIAFLDSGTGGIPYMLALYEKLPDSNFVYLGDTINFPYGEKSQEEVISCATAVIRNIIERWNPKTLVIACNTISVTALDSLRKTFPELPIVGTVPAIKLGAKETKNKRIGLLATNATVKHEYCRKLIQDFASDCTVFSRGDPDLVSFIEHKFFNSTDEEKQAAIKPAMDFFREKNCDTIILGCTHFTHIAEDFKKAAGNEIKIIDSREGVSNQAIFKLKNETGKWKLKEDLPQTENLELQNLSFFVTAATKDEEDEYKLLCKRLNIPWGGIIA